MKTRVKLILTMSLIIPLVSGCSQAQPASANPPYTAASQAQPAAEFSQAQLDSLLAPVALYPDTLLSHVLIASTYPLEVVQADRWAREHKSLSGDDAVKAVEDKDWDPSVKALVAFPDVLRRMSEDLNWTQQLGDAFLANENRVMDTVQNLRNKADAAGTLEKTEHVKIVREERIITIEPAVERVVYVPVYDTRVVYGSWWWPDYPPVYWHHPHSYTYVSGFYWGPRVYIGSSFFFSGCHWRDRRVVVIDRHHHHHHHSHRLYNNRAIVHYRDSRHWHHNPTHRRGVAYYDNRTRERFNSPRESYRESRTYRTNYANPNIRPNQAREQRQSNQFDQRNRHRDDLRSQSNSGQSRIIGSGRVENGRVQTREQPQAVDRAQQLRERMSNHPNRQGPSAPGSNSRLGDHNNRNNQVDRTNRQYQTPYRGNDQQSPRVIPRTESPRTESPRTEPRRIETPNSDQNYRGLGRIRTQPERESSPRQERTAPRNEHPSPRYDRPQRVERIERPQRDDNNGRTFRTERQDSGSGRQREERPIRGGREM